MLDKPLHDFACRMKGVFDVAARRDFYCHALSKTIDDPQAAIAWIRRETGRRPPVTRDPTPRNLLVNIAAMAGAALDAIDLAAGPDPELLRKISETFDKVGAPPAADKDA